MRSALQHRDDGPCIGHPIRQCVVCKCAFRIPEATDIIAAETPALPFAPLGQRFTLVAPTFRKKPGHEKNLASDPVGPITSYQLAVRTFQFKRMQIHFFVNTFVMNSFNRLRIGSGISCPPRKLCHSTDKPARVSASRSRSAMT